ncbi:hypothetical protein [Leadbetterella byssophila]|uniref:Lipocalin-like domain-containing protein n=1 Tax=Leadbetterella byssophila (strain DSM 17132 / JCM 16389 / KACC 11308 / NBRC 106382 / 4M15) TaxID=649349 RepID=E4RQ76_LEAB4|nr:hypothetical protein [Leadbetterella byssophila]ADQ17451.1 hypothetical protein Lbys_1744 [Leadbetterella byssophila DSM 17132]
MKKILFAFVLIAGIWACDKDDPDNEGAPLERLTGTGEKKWRLTKAIAYSSGAEVDLIHNSANRCLGDNELTLRKEGTYLLEDTGVKCSEVDRIEDVWQFNKEPLQIKLAEISLLGRSFNNVVLDIKELKNSTFSGAINQVPTNSLNVNKIELTFSEFK